MKLKEIKNIIKEEVESFKKDNQNLVFNIATTTTQDLQKVLGDDLFLLPGLVGGGSHSSVIFPKGEWDKWKEAFIKKYGKNYDLKLNFEYDRWYGEVIGLDLTSQEPDPWIASTYDDPPASPFVSRRYKGD